MDYLSKILEEVNFTFASQPGAQSNLELHCAVVCCNTTDKTIFITHRSNGHSTNPGKWEFGCAKANSFSSLSSEISHYYHSVYDIELELVMNKERDEQQPLPIAIYEIESSSGGLPKKGIIFVAKAIKPHKLPRSTAEHNQFEWISESDISKIPVNEAVPDFHNTLKFVFAHFDELFELKRGNNNG